MPPPGPTVRVTHTPAALAFCSLNCPAFFLTGALKRSALIDRNTPLLRTQVDFETGELPLSLLQARDDMRWAQRWLFLFPLRHGSMPALFMGFPWNIFSGQVFGDYR